jgi:acetylglutamate kinase
VLLPLLLLLLPLLLLLLQAGVITDLVLLWTVGIRPVLVHGGGPEINSWLGKLGIQPEFKGGLRVTDGERLLFCLHWLSGWVLLCW